MAPLGPFEPAPRLTVGVSGGADSLALALLLRGWVGSRGGALTTLVVDHGLRADAAAEATRATRILSDMDVTARVLRRRGPCPTANIQAFARRARYRLMSDWCARKRVLHLMLAHHLDDQAETLLLRLARGSGLDGLAAMAPISEQGALRLLRPLLGLSKARLEATLAARGISWIEDPTNRDPAHARVRLRRLWPVLAAEGLSAARLGAAAGHLARARVAIEAAVARLLAGAATVHPAGFILLDPVPLGTAPAEVGLRALSRVLMTVGGAAYGPRMARLQRLHGRILNGPPRAATLGGCRIVPRGTRLLIVREARATESLPVKPGETVRWDGRFEIAVRVPRGAPRAQRTWGDLHVSALGADGWAEVRRAVPAALARAIPAPARASLPAVRDRRGPLLVPHLGFRNPDDEALIVAKCRLSPANGLTGVPFTVA